MGARGKPRAEHHPLGSGIGKVCAGCRKPKPLEKFGTKRAAWDGKTARCLECCAASTARTKVAILTMRRRRLAREAR